MIHRSKDIEEETSVAFVLNAENFLLHFCSISPWLTMDARLIRKFMTY